MKIKVKKLKAYLLQHNLSAADLARNMGVDTADIETLLSGDAAKEPVARLFIHYFGADKAAELIDWDAIGKVNPLSCEADRDGD